MSRPSFSTLFLLKYVMTLMFKYYGPESTTKLEEEKKSQSQIKLTIKTIIEKPNWFLYLKSVYLFALQPPRTTSDKTSLLLDLSFCSTLQPGDISEPKLTEILELNLAESWGISGPSL